MFTEQPQGNAIQKPQKSELNLGTFADVELELDNLKKMILEAKPLRMPITNDTVKKIKTGC